MTVFGIAVIVACCWALGNIPAICATLSAGIIAGVLAANWHGTRA